MLLRKYTAKNRRGAAVVELAVFAPVLVAITFGAMELTFYIFLKQSIAIAAYESARAAITSSATDAMARSEAERIFEERSVKAATIQITPDPADAKPGELVTVTITAKMSENTFFRTGIFSPGSVAATAVMVRE